MRTTLSLALLISSAVFAGSGSATLSLTTTPQQTFCSTNHWVNHVEISVVPGGSGKVYVGKSSMNTGTGDGIANILFPNGGAHSEKFELSDATGADTINLCNLYVQGAVTGEYALASWTYTSGSSTGTELVLAWAGSAQSVNGLSPQALLRNPAWYAGISAFTCALNPPSNKDPYFYTNKIRIQTIPGNSGKLTLKHTDGVTTTEFDQLYPNAGTLSQHNGWSEAWELQSPDGQNGLSMGPGSSSSSSCPIVGWLATPAVSGELVQFSVYQLQSGGNVVDPTSPFHFYGTKGVWPTSASAYTYPSVASFTFRMIPGNCSKFIAGSTTSESNFGTDTYKILFPNCYGGWSESLKVFGGATQNITSSTTRYFKMDSSADNFYGEFLLSTYSGSVTPTIGGGSISLTGSAQALGSTSVHRIFVSVVPGYTGKVYVGTSSMNTSTLAGVVAILFPNAVGRWSEEFELIDPLGDGINLANLYVIGDQSGDILSTYTESTGVTPNSPLALKISGAYSAGSTTASLFASSSTPASHVRAQVIPGGSGKVRIGTASMTATQPDAALADTVRVLWPNTGSYNVGEGFSENFKVFCTSGANCIDLNGYRFYSDVTSEQLLIAAWGR